MDKKIIACDLGTGGNKASLYDTDGSCLASTFVPYKAFYPKTGWHEQRPMDWWNSVISVFLVFKAILFMEIGRNYYFITLNIKMGNLSQNLNGVLFMPSLFLPSEY